MTTEQTAAGVETPAAEPRLAFRSWLPFVADGMTCYVAVTERLSRKRSVTFTYALRVVGGPLAVPSVFHFFKEGDPVPRELKVYQAGHTCTCPSGTYRRGQPCRHLEAVQYLTEQGVI